MGRVGKGKQQINTTVPDVIADTIDARRDPLRWSRSEFVLAVLQDWQGRGFPAVSAVDQAMIVANKWRPPAKK